MLFLSESSVIKYIDWCITVILSLEAQYMHWPNELEKAKTKCDFKDNSGFKDCIGIINGSLFPFAAAPAASTQSNSFFSYKKKYGISGLLACNSKRQIIYTNIGWAGCTHDNRIFSNSKLVTQLNLFFSGDEYLLGDSGFGCTPHVIVPYRNPKNQILTERQETFNGILSEVIQIDIYTRTFYI